jgi:hypothetical protein
LEGWLDRNMKNQFKLALALFLLGFILLPGYQVTSAEIYKWKDKDGNVFYSDAPPPAGMDAEMKKFKEESPPTQKPKPEVGSPLPKGEIAKEKRPYNSINVTMYMTSW